MRLFKDIISGDELFSDVYPMKVVHECLYEVEGKLVTEEDTFDDSKLGANPSAEEAQEETEKSVKKGCNIVLANRLVETGYAKKDYKTYIKSYMKKVIAKLEEKGTPAEQVDAFKKSAGKAVTYILENFGEWQFFLGENMDPDGMVVLMGFREDGLTPYMLFFKDGLEEEKL